jgi:hypothetical protein
VRREGGSGQGETQIRGVGGHRPLVRSTVDIAARLDWTGGRAIGSSPDRNPVVTAGMIGRRSDLAD